MKSLKAVFVAVATLLAVQSWAGPEHDHGAPTFQAPKGGVLKSTHHSHFELVKTATGVSLYAYDEAGKSLETKGFKLTGQLELPRKKATPITLADKGTHWEAAVNAQGAHRFTLKINVDDGKEKDNVQFTIENK